MNKAECAESELQLKGNRWLLVSLVLLWLLVGWFWMPTLYAGGQFFRIGVFGVCAVVYFANTSDAAHRWHYPRGYRYFFPLLILCHLSLLWASNGSRMVWLLLLPTISQAIMFLPWRTMTWVLGVLFLLGLFPCIQLPYDYSLNHAVNFISSVSFTVGASWVIRREYESRKKLHEAHEKLRLHAENIEALAVAEERNRFAREIHDGVAHHLTAANVLVEAGLALLPTENTAAARDPLQKAQGQIRAALGDLRQSIRTSQLEAAAVDLPTRIQQVITQGGFPAELDVQGAARRLTAEAEHALFRVAQEALTNARKHAPGEAVRLQLVFGVDQRVTLRVENTEPVNGTASGDGAFGLLSLRHRLASLGGSFEAGSGPKGMFVVRAEVGA